MWSAKFFFSFFTWHIQGKIQVKTKGVSRLFSCCSQANLFLVTDLLSSCECVVYHFSLTSYAVEVGWRLVLAGLSFLVVRSDSHSFFFKLFDIRHLGLKGRVWLICYRLTRKGERNATNRQWHQARLQRCPPTSKTQHTQESCRCKYYFPPIIF